MSLYKVKYHGFVIVEAEDEDEAFDLYDCSVEIYGESEITEIEEVDDISIYVGD